MNLIEEDFSTSDAWLSDILFAQLRDLNSEYKDSNTPSDFLLSETFSSCNTNIPLLEDDVDDVPLQNLKSTPLDSYETSHKVNSFSNSYDISDEVLDLSLMLLKEHNIENVTQTGNIIDIVDNIPTTQQNTGAINGVGMILNHVNDIVLPPVLDTNEELKILQFLENQSKDEIIGKCLRLIFIIEI